MPKEFSSYIKIISYRPIATDEALSYNPNTLVQFNVLITSQKWGEFNHAFKESRDI